MTETSITLLQRLKHPDADTAWDRFAKLYSPMIMRFVHRMGLNDAEVQDCLQETLIALVRILPDFEYAPAQGKFRNFVLTIAKRNALARVRRAARRNEMELLDHEAGADALQEPDDADQANWQQSLLDEAWKDLCCSGRLEDRTIGAFEAYAFRAETVDAVTKKYGISANTLYQIRSRIIEMLKQEVQRIEAVMEEAAWRS